MPDMLDTADAFLATPRSLPVNDDNPQDSGATARARLRADLDRLLAEARPRLARLARLRGVPADSVDDLAQEALLEAWRTLDHLRDAARFDAWLDGILRNVCQRHARQNAQAARYEQRATASLAWGDELAAPDTTDAPEPPDLLALDPDEALTRQEMQTLLDRALGRLPQSARQALELRYLEELPQREVAARLGMTSNALDVRLHRARKQLRDVLSGELRADAETFGLPVGAQGDADAGWRETRLWCVICGERRLWGVLEALPNGNANFRMRCPTCWSQFGVYTMHWHDHPILSGLRSLAAANKRALRFWADFYTHACATPQPRCMCQHQGVRIRIAQAEDTPGPTLPDRRYVVHDCPVCGGGYSWIGTLLWNHPVAQRFMASHPRYLAEPETLVNYAGQPAFRFLCRDLTSAARLTVFAHAETLAVLATVEE